MRAREKYTVVCNPCPVGAYSLTGEKKRKDVGEGT